MGDEAGERMQTELDSPRGELEGTREAPATTSHTGDSDDDAQDLSLQAALTERIHHRAQPIQHQPTSSSETPYYEPPYYEPDANIFPVSAASAASMMSAGLVGGSGAMPAGAPEMDICTVCHESGTNTQLDCGHRFHGRCVADWFRSGPRRTCPLCRDAGATPGVAAPRSERDDELRAAIRHADPDEDW